MRHFSILQASMSIVLSEEPEAKPIGLAFSDDPGDSSIVRLRVATSDSDNACEITFDRNGRERSRRLWPVKYPAFSEKTPAELDEEAAEAEKRVAEAQSAADAEKGEGPVDHENTEDEKEAIGQKQKGKAKGK